MSYLRLSVCLSGGVIAVMVALVGNFAALYKSTAVDPRQWPPRRYVAPSRAPWKGSGSGPVHLEY